MKRVLLVDDDSDITWGIGRCLTRAGLTVATCGDGAEALELLESQDFDALVTDVQMPRVNGLTLLDWARRNRPRMRVVVMTAFGSEAVMSAAVHRGAVLYLEKPLDPVVLVEVLRGELPPNAFSGSIEGIDLFDCIQMVLLTRGRHTLEVQGQGGSRCRLWVERGDVVHAECERCEGVEAVERCIGFEGGRFVTLPWSEPPKRTIALAGNVLLMEAARTRDEKRRDAGIAASGSAGRED